MAAPPPRHLPRPQVLAERVFETLQRFPHVEAVSEIVLLLAAIVAMIWANSSFAQSYDALWKMPISIGLGTFVFSKALHFWINDILMTVFFLVVGMEIRREIHEGALNNPRQAALPIAAALGGVIVPALIYIAINTAPITVQGWAVPTATDIAFAVGILALLGRSIPVNIRVFLLTLAIIDDVIAVLIIAFLYSAGVTRVANEIRGLLGTAKDTHRMERQLQQLQLANREMLPPVVRVQSALHPWVAYGVMPLFDLANAGVSLSGVDLSAGGSQLVMSGVAIALLAGKPIGVISATWLMVRIGWGRLPPGVSWAGVCLIGLLAGIGFTMSIFIALLAFHDEHLLGAAKVGVIVGSVVAACVGLCWGALRVKGTKPMAEQ